ncbi:hypothetical protein D3C80_2037820 [compost metagenome]
MQRRAGHIEAPIQAQPDRVVQQPFALHAIKHTVGRGAVGYVEHAFLLNVQRLLQDRMDLPGRPAQCQAGKDKAHFQQQQEFASHESGIQ